MFLNFFSVYYAYLAGHEHGSHKEYTGAFS